MTSSARDESLSAILSDCRLLRKDDLVLVKGATALKVPECFQKVPRRVQISRTGRILAMCVDNQGTLTPPHRENFYKTPFFTLNI